VPASPALGSECREAANGVKIYAYDVNALYPFVRE